MQPLFISIIYAIIGFAFGCDKPAITACYGAFNTRIPQAEWAANAGSIHDAYCQGLASARTCVVTPLQGCDANEVRNWKSKKLSAEFACQSGRRELNMKYIACRGDKPEVMQREQTCKNTHLGPLSGTPTDAAACKAMQDTLKCVCGAYHACAEESRDFICERFKEAMRPTADLYKCQLSLTFDNGAATVYASVTSLLFTILLSLAILY